MTVPSAYVIAKPPQSFLPAVVLPWSWLMFFFDNEVILLRKFTKIMQIFNKTNNPKGQGIIQWTQSFLDFIFELLKND